jgi:predicted nucleic acid-binding Zn ribbon protein
MSDSPRKPRASAKEALNSANSSLKVNPSSATPSAISTEQDAAIRRKQAAEKSAFHQEEDEERPPIYRRPSKPLAVETILRGVLAAKGLDKRLAAYRWVKNWEEIVGTGIARRTRPRSLKSGTLTVEVTDAAWAQELQFRSDVIISRLGKFVDNDELVRDIRFVVKGR